MRFNQATKSKKYSTKESETIKSNTKSNGKVIPAKIQKPGNPMKMYVIYYNYYMIINKV